MEDDKNLDFFDENNPKEENSNDFFNALSQDITLKIGSLNDELDSIIFDLEKTKENSIDTDDEVEFLVEPERLVKKDKQDIEELINTVLEQTTKEEKPIVEDSIEKKTSKSDDKDNTKEIIETINKVLGDDIEVKINKKIVNITISTHSYRPIIHISRKPAKMTRARASLRFTLLQENTKKEIFPSM